MQSYGLPVVVAINEFVSDTVAEVQMVKEKCLALGVEAALTSVWEKGSEGGVALAEAVLAEIDHTQVFSPLYDTDNETIETKVTKIVQKIYGGKGVAFSKKALTQMKNFEENGWGNLPICMAKTQYSLSDDPSLLGRPSDFIVTIREFVPKLGAGFIVALTGDVMTMPGLPKQPAALNMDVAEDGTVSGLF